MTYLAGYKLEMEQAECVDPRHAANFPPQNPKLILQLIWNTFSEFVFLHLPLVLYSMVSLSERPSTTILSESQDL